jgi:hypothetical protein
MASRSMLRADLARSDGGRREAGNDQKARHRHLHRDGVGRKTTYQASQTSPGSHFWKPQGHPPPILPSRRWHFNSADVGSTRCSPRCGQRAHRICDHVFRPAPIDARAARGSGHKVIDRQITVVLSASSKACAHGRSISSAPLVARTFLQHHGLAAAIYWHMCPWGTFPARSKQKKAARPTGGSWRRPPGHVSVDCLRSTSLQSFVTRPAATVR